MVQVMDSVLTARVPLAGLVGGGCEPSRTAVMHFEITTWWQLLCHALWCALTHAESQGATCRQHSHSRRYSPDLEVLASRHCLLHKAAASAWRDFRL